MIRKLFLILILILMSVAMGKVFGISNPPYDVYGYLSDATDNPPVNYMKVVDPGRTGEENASYVVLGISYPRTYQAVSSAYSGELVIPAYIDGLPVRKINEAAFIACSRITSVRIPATVREIGARAFVDCWALKSVMFESGISVVGEAAFSNCVALTSIRFPKTLSRLGFGCFQGCVALTDVYFDGNAPRLAVSGQMLTGTPEKSVLGEGIYRQTGYVERFKVHINRGTYGWIAPYEKGVPEKWPTDYGYMRAHETVAETGGRTGTEDGGFVTVITEVKGSAIAVPENWSRQFAEYAAKFGSDFTASLTKPTGKKDAAGNPMFVWQDYVAGTDPTDLADRFSAVIEMQSGNPVLSVCPDLPAEEKVKRKYTTWGKARLSDASWTEVPPGLEKDYNFFKISVEMR